MENTYKILYEGGTGEIEVKKSRFIAQTFPIHTQEEAAALIEQVKKKYYDARHNCFAYVAGRSHSLQRFSDDGEPAGTAGKPILETLLNEDVHDCLLVVTRYFGGTLLGTGGLTRAYRESAVKGLAASVVVERQDGHLYTVTTDYSRIGKLQYLFSERGIPVLDSRFTENAAMDILLTAVNEEAVLKAVADASAGTAQVEKKEALAFGLKDGEVLLL